MSLLCKKISFSNAIHLAYCYHLSWYFTPCRRTFFKNWFGLMLDLYAFHSLMIFRAYRPYHKPLGVVREPALMKRMISINWGSKIRFERLTEKQTKDEKRLRRPGWLRTWSRTYRPLVWSIYFASPSPIHPAQDLGSSCAQLYLYFNQILASAHIWFLFFVFVFFMTRSYLMDSAGTKPNKQKKACRLLFFFSISLNS